MAVTTSSGSSMVVDLGEAADLDDTTSKLFFSDHSSGVEPGLSWSWSAAAEITSTLVSQDSLVALCDKHGVPSELTPVGAHHLGWRACTTPPVGSNKMCVYSTALDAGLRFPLHEFYVRVLRRYRLAPSQLTPNAWTYLAAFVLLCEDAGVEPLVSAFRYFFTLYAHSHHGEPTGYHHFQPYHEGGRHRLFSGNLPQWRSGWKSKFFFLDCPSGWKCPVKWGRPKREDARRVQLTDKVVDKLKQMGCMDIKRFLANREMPVGDQAPLQSAAKAEGGAVGAAPATVGWAAPTTTSKRSRLSSSSAVFSQPQPPLPTSPPPGFRPIRASSTGGSSRGHSPPPQQRSFGESSTSAPRAWLLSDTRDRVTPTHPQLFAGLTPAAREWELPGARARAPAPAPAASIGGSSEDEDGEQASTIATLTEALKLASSQNARCSMDLEQLKAHLRAANDNSSRLKEKLVEVNDYVAEREQLLGRLRTVTDEVAHLKEEHAAEKAQLKEELATENAQLREELVADAERLQHESFAMGVNRMMEITLALYDVGAVVDPDHLKAEAEMLLGIEHGNTDLLRFT